MVAMQEKNNVNITGSVNKKLGCATITGKPCFEKAMIGLPKKQSCKYKVFCVKRNQCLTNYHQRNKTITQNMMVLQDCFYNLSFYHFNVPYIIPNCRIMRQKKGTSA